MAGAYGGRMNDTTNAVVREPEFTNCDICDVRPAYRLMNASGVEGVICEECDEKLSLPALLRPMAE